MPELFAVIRTHGPNWNDGRPTEEQENLRGHGEFMNALHEEGMLILGGTLEGSPDILLIVRAEASEEIRARLAADPWSKIGLLSIDRISPWRLRLGSLE